MPAQKATGRSGADQTLTHPPLCVFQWKQLDMVAIPDFAMGAMVCI